MCGGRKRVATAQRSRDTCVPSHTGLCEDRVLDAYPWTPFPPRRARRGPGPHRLCSQKKRGADALAAESASAVRAPSTPHSCEAVGQLEQWLQRHPEAGSSWPSWPKASQKLGFSVGRHVRARGFRSRECEHDMCVLLGEKTRSERWRGPHSGRSNEGSYLRLIDFCIT